MKSLVAKAQQYAKDFHKNNYRLNGDNLYVHSKNVVEILESQKLTNEDLLTAAYLHEVVKINPQTFTEISKTFNTSVAEILRLYGDISEKHLRINENKNVQVENTIKTLLNLSLNTSVLSLRLADKVENLKTAGVFSKDDRKAIALRATFIYAPLARFLSLGKFVRDLEDTSFKVLSPQQFTFLENKLVSIENEVKSFFKEANIFLTQVLAEEGINASIDYRMKSVYSTYKKIKKYDTSVDNALKKVPDVVAFRILVEELGDCYKVLETLNSVWNLNETHFSDWISNPKPNGYKSIHAVYDVTDKFIAEFQIKTRDMHEYNEYGGASHALYKLGSNFKKLINEDPNLISRLSQNDAISSLLDFESKPIASRIYVFTPKQDIIELPTGATVIDFAYAVHEHVGRDFMGALVNGLIARANTVLKDGDVIKIKTSKKPKMPSRDWLDFVVTIKAKTYIKKELKLG